MAYILDIQTTLNQFNFQDSKVVIKDSELKPSLKLIWLICVDLALPRARPVSKTGPSAIALFYNLGQALCGTSSDPRTLTDPEHNYICKNP